MYGGCGGHLSSRSTSTLLVYSNDPVCMMDVSSLHTSILPVSYTYLFQTLQEILLDVQVCCPLS